MDIQDLFSKPFHRVSLFITDLRNTSVESTLYIHIIRKPSVWIHSSQVKPASQVQSNVRAWRSSWKFEKEKVY